MYTVHAIETLGELLLTRLRGVISVSCFLLNSFLADTSYFKLVLVWVKLRIPYLLIHFNIINNIILLKYQDAQHYIEWILTCHIALTKVINLTMKG